MAKGPLFLSDTRNITYLLYVLMTTSFSTHLQFSGKQLKHKVQRNVPENIDYSTSQRGHQYFMEGYILESMSYFVWRMVLFGSKPGAITAKRSTHNAMHEVKVAICKWISAPHDQSSLNMRGWESWNVHSCHQFVETNDSLPMSWWNICLFPVIYFAHKCSSHGMNLSPSTLRLNQ